MVDSFQDHRVSQRFWRTCICVAAVGLVAFDRALLYFLAVLS